MTIDTPSAALRIPGVKYLGRADCGSADYAHNLADLQAEAKKRYRMTPEQTLEAAQALREYGLITNPCVEERRLPAAERCELSRLVISHGCTTGSIVSSPYRKGPGWFDREYGGESGITLTLTPYAAKFGIKLSRNETRIYGLVHARLLQLFTSPDRKPVTRSAS